MSSSSSSLTLSFLLHVADAEGHGSLLLLGPVPGADCLGDHLLPLQHLTLCVVSAARLARLWPGGRRQLRETSEGVGRSVGKFRQSLDLTWDAVLLVNCSRSACSVLCCSSYTTSLASSISTKKHQTYDEIPGLTVRLTKKGFFLPFFAWSSSYCSTFQMFSSLSSSSAVIRLCRMIRSGGAPPAWKEQSNQHLNGSPFFCILTALLERVLPSCWDSVIPFSFFYF